MEKSTRLDEKGPLFSIFIPTFNRCQVITKALDSVIRQSINSYEIIVIDDGSMDNTYNTIQRWQNIYNCHVKYKYQENKGKHIAHNYAVSIARGDLLMVLDSDDELLPDCLETIKETWLSIPPDERRLFAGVEGLCITSDGSLHGNAFPYDTIDSDYLETRNYYKIRGEKRNAIRLEVLREYPYPAFTGEYHVRPSYIWKKISHKYKFRYINKPLQIVDISSSGLTKSSSKRRLLNVKGLFNYWREDISYHLVFLDKRTRIKHYAEYCRYGLHCKFNIVKQYKEVPERLLWVLSLPRALPNYISDLTKKFLYKI